MDIVFTEHAKIRMLQRKISEQDIGAVTDKPDNVGESFKGRIIANRKVAKGTLEIAYKRVKTRIVIITCYWIKEE